MDEFAVSLTYKDGCKMTVFCDDIEDATREFDLASQEPVSTVALLHNGATIRTIGESGRHFL